MNRATHSKSRHAAMKVGTLVATAGLVLGLGSGCQRDRRPVFRQPPASAERTPERAAANASDLVIRAKNLESQGADDEALREFERAIEANPSLTVAYLGAADIYRERGDFASAEVHYRDATRLEPRNFNAQYYHAFSLQMLNRLSEAIRAYLRALSLRPTDFDANLNLATAYLQIAEPAQALPYAERAVESDPMSGPARVNLGAIYATLGRHDDAVIEYQQAAEHMELGPELLLNLADSLGKSGRYAEMASTLDTLVRVAPTAAAHERLGSALFRLKRYDAALNSFRDAVRMDNDHFPAHNGVGVCLLNRYLWSKQTDRAALDEALGALRESLRIRPSQPRIVELVRRYGS